MPVVPSTRLILLLLESAMYMVPKLLTAIPSGLFNCALTAGPPSPPAPPPATVVIIPVILSILLILSLPVSATYRFPLLSKAVEQVVYPCVIIVIGWFKHIGVKRRPACADIT